MSIEMVVAFFVVISATQTALIIILCIKMSELRKTINLKHQ